MVERTQSLELGIVKVAGVKNLDLLLIHYGNLGK